MEQIFQFVATACGIAMATLGGLALTQNPHQRSHQFFFLTSFFCIAWMLSLSLGFSHTASQNIESASVWFRIAHGSGITAISFMAAFMMTYPSPLKKSSFFMKMYLIGSILLAIGAATTPLVYDHVIIYTDGSLGDQFGPLYTLFISHALGTEITCIVLTLKRIANSSGITRRKIQYACFGFLTFALATLITNGILPLFEVIIFQREAVLFSLFFLIPAFISLYQHRFFRASYTALNLTRHFLLLLSFWSAAGASYALITVIFTPQQILSPFIISSLIGLSTYHLLSRQYPELISESYLHFRQTLFDCKQELLSTSSLHELQMLLEETFMKKLNISSCTLHRIGKKKHTLLKPFSKKSFVELMNAEHQKILVGEEMSYSPNFKKWKGILEKEKASILIAFYSQDELIGFLTLGQRPSHPSFGKEEIHLLEECQEQLEKCISNLLFSEGFFREKRILNKTIAQKTQQLRAQFNRTKNVLKKQSDYLSYAAHEIKNPLAVLMLQLETSLSEEHLDPQTHDDLKQIEQSAEQLHILTQNLFSAQQYELNKVPFSPKKRDIQLWLEIMTQQIKTLLEKHHLRFHYENSITTPLSMSLDESKMTQVIQNVINNAIKFTPRGGEVSLSIHESPLWLHIVVSDTGPGIPAHLRQEVFKKYQHGKEKNGLGIGLFLCKKIIQMHHGKIRITEAPSGGTRVIIQMRKQQPLNETEEQQPHSQEQLQTA